MVHAIINHFRQQAPIVHFAPEAIPYVFMKYRLIKKPIPLFYKTKILKMNIIRGS